jgi:hypothetical protein
MHRAFGRIDDVRRRRDRDVGQRLIRLSATHGVRGHCHVNAATAFSGFDRAS